MVAILSRPHCVFVFVFDELYLYLYFIRFLPVYLYLYLKLQKKMHLYLYSYLIKLIWPQPWSACRITCSSPLAIGGGGIANDWRRLWAVAMHHIHASQSHLWLQGSTFGCLHLRQWAMRGSTLHCRLQGRFWKASFPKIGCDFIKFP